MLLPRLFRTSGMLGVVLLLAACAAAPVPEPLRPALVVQPGVGDLGLEAYAGEVHAREEPELSFRIAGKIARRLADAGTRVEKGQLLAELDPADVRLQAQAHRAQLASAESDLALARTELARYKDLAARQLVSRSLYDSRVAALKSAEARMREARAQSAASGNQVAYASLRAPQDGVIAQRLAEAGQVVAAGQPVFVLAVDGEREVAISVPEHSVSGFQVGRELAVELWATPGKRFPARLRELSPAADPLTRTYAARVSFASQGGDVELGQSARVLARDQAVTGMSLPLSALTQRDGKPAVWVVYPVSGKLRLTPVTVGAYSERGVPILSGLQPGDWVVAAGVHLLRDGQQVAPVDRDNRPVRMGGAAAAVNRQPAAN